MLGQPAIEATLLARLGAHSVHYSERATAAAEDDAGVTIHTSAGRAVRARYAVAADGARSTLRAALGIPFAGTDARDAVGGARRVCRHGPARASQRGCHV